MRTIRVVSSFCGAGFADYALHRASEQTGISVEVVLAFDSWDRAVAVYNANLPSRAIVADAKQLTRADLPAHDLFIGGPPCQSHSTAGPKDCHCHIGGPASPRCCLADFERLAAGSAYLMENVRARLVNAPWSEQLCALDFGDVTTRKRWWYSDHLLHVVRTPGPRRLRDIRDHEADRIALDKSAQVAAKKAKYEAQLGRTYNMPPRTDEDAIGSLGATSFNNLQSGSTLIAVRPNGGARRAIGDDEVPGSLTADSWHGTNMGGASMVAVGEDEAIGSVTGQAWHQSPPPRMRIGVRSYPQAFTEIAEDDALGSVTAHTHDQPLRAAARRRKAKPGRPLFAWPPTSLQVRMNGQREPVIVNETDVLPPVMSQQWHGENPAIGVRCPSLLEMARAHSIPDSWDWAGATKTDRGLMIANGWCIGMGTAVLAAMLRAVAASLERAA